MGKTSGAHEVDGVGLLGLVVHVVGDRHRAVLAHLGPKRTSSVPEAKETVLGQYRTAKWVRVDGNAEDIQAGKDVRRQMQGQYRTLERVCIGSTRHRKGCAWADTRSVQDTGKGVRRQLRGAHLAVDAKPQRDRLPLKQFTPPQKKRRQQKSTGP
eukprot:467231-Rhodomonas_salina.2